MSKPRLIFGGLVVLCLMEIAAEASIRAARVRRRPGRILRSL